MNRTRKLVAAFAIIIVLAAGLLLWWQAPVLFLTPTPTVQPLFDDDQEVALLLPATDIAEWERFVQAVLHVQQAQGLLIDADRAFPASTAAVPEIAWRTSGTSSWLRVRWYKLTSGADVRFWVSQLTARQPAPLAVIGGDHSNRAADLAEALADRCGQLVAPPSFLITTATAETVRGRDLLDRYSERCFRFCFTNRQMARAIADFLWSHPELPVRPDAWPVYLLDWNDNSYSADLADRFQEFLPGMPWATADGQKPGFWRRHLPHSIGGISRPNALETAVAEELLDQLQRRPEQRQALLVLPGNSWPARRFLHALARAAPPAAERLVVTTGDSVDFNTVYRDGNLTWAIQDLPFKLVLFCHRNPTDPKAGFRGGATPTAVLDQDLTKTTAADTGTYDLLLYADIVTALTNAAFRENRLLADANQVTANLRSAQTVQFDPRGNRLDATGEHLVYLEPQRLPGRMLPRAWLRVYRRTAHDGWELQPPEMRLTYGAPWPTQEPAP